jgi:hypothetical protein
MMGHYEHEDIDETWHGVHCPDCRAGWAFEEGRAASNEALMSAGTVCRYCRRGILEPFREVRTFHRKRAVCNCGAEASEVYDRHGIYAGLYCCDAHAEKYGGIRLDYEPDPFEPLEAEE